MSTLIELIDSIAVSEAKETAIKNKAPDKLPLNLTAQGWSGPAIRQAFAKALTDSDSSLLSELKDKMNIIKTTFEEIVNDSQIEFRVTENYYLQFKYHQEIEWTNVVLLTDLLGTLVSVGIEPPAVATTNGLWIDTNG